MATKKQWKYFSIMDYEKEEEYVQLFSDCGWQYLQDYCGYSYFRKSAKDMRNGEEEIFCDDHSRLQMMERVFKGRLLPLLVLFFCILVPQFILNVFVYHNYIVASLFSIILLTYIAVFTAYGIKYYRHKKNIEK